MIEDRVRDVRSDAEIIELHGPGPEPDPTMPERRASLEERVVRVAEAALAERIVVSPIDVLIGLGWLTPRPSTP